MNRRSLFSALIAGPVIAAAKPDTPERKLVMMFDYQQEETIGCSFGYIRKWKFIIDGVEIKRIWRGEVYSDGTAAIHTYDILGDGKQYASGSFNHPLPPDTYTRHGVLTRVIRGKLRILNRANSRG